MARGINIDDLIKNLSFREKKELNDALGDNGIENGKDLIDAFKHVFSDGGGFSDSREKGLFGKLADQKSEYNEAKRLLKSLEEFKNGGVEGMTHKEDAELLHEMGLDLDNMEESSRALEKNLKDVKFSNDFSSRVDKLNDGFSRIGSSIKDIGHNMNNIVEPWAKIDKHASKYAKSVAMGAAGMAALRKNTIDNVVNSKIGINYNIGADELIDAQQKYVQSVGRNLKIDNTQQESLAAMTAVMGDRSTELASAFENFGVNLNETAEHSGKMFDKAAKRGVSFEKLTDNVAKNIKIAQNYTFKNGLKGLESMAAKAVALKMDMAQVASLADKVSSVEGSIDVASKLQVLGGPFASMADPLGMMNEGLNDMEGLMDRVTKMVGGLGNFNKTTGEVEVSSFNKKRVQAAAQAMGVDYSTLMESVNAQAKRESIKREIKASSNASSLNEDMQELLMNTATFDKKTGKYGVSIGGKTKTLDDLEENDYKQLIKETQSESDDIKDIAKMLRSYFDYTEGFNKQEEAVQAQMVGPIGTSLEKIIGWAGKQTWLLRIIATASILGNIGNIVGNVKNIVSRFRGGGSGKLGGKLGGNVINKARSLIGGKAAGSIGGGNVLRTAKGKEFEVIGGKLVNKTTGKTVYGNAVKNVLESAERTMGKDAVANVMKQSSKTTEKAIKESSEISKNVSKSGKIARNLGKPLRKVKQIKNLVKAGKGAKVLGAVAKGAGKKIPIIGGLVSSGIEAYENKDKFKDRATRGTAVGRTAGAGVGAVLGGAVGSLLGPLGTVAGSIAGEWIGKHVGGFIGGIHDKRVTKNRAAVDNQLKEYGIERKGDYSVRNLKKINKAIQTGELSDKLRRKLLEQGDTDLIKQIDAKKAEVEEKDEVKKDKETQRQALINGGKGEKVAKRIKNANFIVGNAYFGGKGFGAKSSGGFNPLNPLSMLNPLNPIAPLIKGAAENGFNPEALKLSKFSKKLNKKEGENSLLNGGKLDVNISGTIKIEANGKQFNMDELMKDQGFKQELAKLISNQIAQNNTQSNRNEKV